MFSGGQEKDWNYQKWSSLALNGFYLKWLFQLKWCHSNDKKTKHNVQTSSQSHTATEIESATEKNIYVQREDSSRAAGRLKPLKKHTNQ